MNNSIRKRICRTLEISKIVSSGIIVKISSHDLKKVRTYQVVARVLDPFPAQIEDILLSLGSTI